ncbi:diguanylate cyclase [Bacillus suaedaesalsae]|uniref:GGDEF domain-containing protein n=1 Tax=Bacillus suaedaesalsae TaxID=2810349 RepID=A0ABS2DEE2_9BACI|nr:GGDEF domain-containing protein [Bacillus suaedaesalsae]
MQNKKLKLYHYSYCTIFAVMFLYLYEPVSAYGWLVIITFSLVATVYDLRPIVLHSGDNLTLATPLLFTAGVLYGVSTIFFINLLVTILLMFFVPKKWFIHIFNGVQYTISGVIGLWVYKLIESNFTFEWNELVAFAGFSIVFYIMNVLLLTTFIHFQDGREYREMFPIFMEKKTIIIYFTTLAIGLLMVTVVKHEGLVGFLVFCLILFGLTLTYRSFYSMFDHFKSLSEKDELTRLYNHRYFQEYLEKVIEQGQKVSLLIIDLDHFKKYNDTFGHPKGDVLLRDIANIIKQNISESAIASRYGGEEFTVILPDVDKKSAVAIAERIRVAVASHQFEGSEQMPYKCITVSIGVSVFPEMSMTREGLIDLADQALYTSKNTRNKVSY